MGGERRGEKGNEEERREKTWMREKKKEIGGNVGERKEDTREREGAGEIGGMHVNMGLVKKVNGGTRNCHKD